MAGPKLVILVDDREKTPWDFTPMGVEVEVTRLDVGDYSVRWGDMDFRDVFAIERKSLDDLARSVGTDRARFEAEIQRAQDLAHFKVYVEGWPHDVEAGNYYSRIHPNSIFGTIRAWETYKYPQLEFEFAGDRYTAAQRALTDLDRWFLLHGSGLM
jgi:ERCC4-type nuclease